MNSAIQYSMVGITQPEGSIHTIFRAINPIRWDLMILLWTHHWEYFGWLQWRLPHRGTLGYSCSSISRAIGCKCTYVCPLALSGLHISQLRCTSAKLVRSKALEKLIFHSCWSHFSLNHSSQLGCNCGRPRCNAYMLTGETRVGRGGKTVGNEIGYSFPPRDPAYISQPLWASEANISQTEMYKY